MCGSVRGRGQVTRILESLRNRGQFGPVADTQRVGEASGQADARALDKRFDFAEPGRARMIAELGGCLQTQHLCTELVLSASDSAPASAVAIASARAPWHAENPGLGDRILVIDSAPTRVPTSFDEGEGADRLLR